MAAPFLFGCFIELKEESSNCNFSVFIQSSNKNVPVISPA